MVIYAGIAAFVLAVIGANLPGSALFSDRSSDRQSQVVSEFITLSAAPDDSGLDFLSRNRTLRHNRKVRLEHLQPQLLTAFAVKMSVSADRLQSVLLDPNLTNAFDYTGVRFSKPATFHSGTSGTWNWVLATQDPEGASDDPEEAADCGLHGHCGLWMLYWDADTWFYAPVGHPDLENLLAQVEPDLGAALSDVKLGN
jgi:hypothetical protein